jgi:hypothetical protein
VDADVLIDYADTDTTVLTLFSRHHGSICVLTPVLDQEVDSLDAADCDRLGITVVQVETELLLEAGKRGGALSLHDWATLLVAGEMGARCITNDKALRRECGNVGISCVWGLEIMVELVRGGNMVGADAIRVAESIHEINPGHISRRLLDRFRGRLLDAGA